MSNPTQLRPELTELDRFGNVYVVSSVNEVSKYDEDDQKFGYYSNNTLGTVGYVDVTNPLKILVYYPSYYTAVFLDRQLRETGRVNFLELSLGEIRTVATAVNGSLWIFDYNEQILKHVDSQGKVLLQSNDLRLTLGKNYEIVEIKQKGEEVFLLTSTGEVLLFDLFGYFKKRLDVGPVFDIQILGGAISLYQEDAILRYDHNAMEMMELEMTPATSSGKVIQAREFKIIATSSGYQRISSPNR